MYVVCRYVVTLRATVAAEETWWSQISLCQSSCATMGCEAHDNAAIGVHDWTQQHITPAAVAMVRALSECVRVVADRIRPYKTQSISQGRTRTKLCGVEKGCEIIARGRGVRVTDLPWKFWRGGFSCRKGDPGGTRVVKWRAVAQRSQFRKGAPCR